MNVAYADSSCLVAVALGEAGYEGIARRLERYDVLLASNLLEAELRSALEREEVDETPGPLLDRLTWVFPDRALTPELQEVLATGHLLGADLWHLACALFLRRSLPALHFLTLDQRQETVARELGFGGEE